MWRQGDVFIQACPQVPPEAKKLPHCILAKGELTGHAHRVEESGAAVLFEFGGSQYLDVKAAQATVAHEEHGPIVLPRGTYRVWIQREYSPEEIRRVVD